MKTLFFILLFVGGLAKGCSKILSKNGDEIATGVSKLVSPAARVLARQHVIEDDSLSSEDLENWDDVTYTNYFLLDLSKIASKINTLDIKDTTYKSRVIRDFNWLQENNFAYSIEKMNDSTNLDLQNGAIYFRNLYVANNYSKYVDYFIEEQANFREFIVKKDPSKDDEELLRPIFKKYYFINYFPFHEGLAARVRWELNRRMKGI
jgi:hypothetical protein